MNSSPDEKSKSLNSQGQDIYAGFKAKVDRIAPFLLETRWFAMTYMMIPKLLRDADALIAEMEAADAGPDQRNLVALTTKLRYLREGFERIARKS